MMSTANEASPIDEIFPEIDWFSAPVGRAVKFEVIGEDQAAMVKQNKNIVANERTVRNLIVIPPCNSTGIDISSAENWPNWPFAAAKEISF